MAPGCFRKKKKCSATMRWRLASSPSAPGCPAVPGCHSAFAGLLAPVPGSFMIGAFCAGCHSSLSARTLVACLGVMLGQIADETADCQTLGAERRVKHALIHAQETTGMSWGQKR